MDPWTWSPLGSLIARFSQGATNTQSTSLPLETIGFSISTANIANRLGYFFTSHKQFLAKYHDNCSTTFIINDMFGFCSWVCCSIKHCFGPLYIKTFGTSSTSQTSSHCYDPYKRDQENFFSLASFTFLVSTKNVKVLLYIFSSI